VVGTVALARLWLKPLPALPFDWWDSIAVTWGPLVSTLATLGEV
jgi:hypothetical protein